jgi:Ras GTPase-activating-like protein IQGAP2/3
LTKKFPKVKEEQLWKVIGFYVYFKFLNPVIVNPTEANIGTGAAISMKTTTNLLQVSKVLQTLFDLRLFPTDNPLSVLNNWMSKKRIDIVQTYFTDLIDVPEPEDYLRMSRYTELYSKTKPLIIIRLREIFVSHSLISEHIDAIAKDEEDPLRIILDELGEEIPNVSKENTAEAMLTLESRFAGASVEKELDKNADLFDATKELVIQIFKAAPVEEAEEPNLVSVFKLVKEWSAEQADKTVSKLLVKAQENLDNLEKAEMVSKKDNYDSFLRAVALEVTNRTERREALRKEIAKLRATIKELVNHAKFLQTQIEDFDAYLKSVREQAMAKVAKGKKKVKPLKFSYKDLEKRGIILDSEVPQPSRSRTKFLISMEGLGKFHIEAKIAGVSVGKMEIELEELLEKKENRENKLELEQIVLNVSQTILLLNKHFLK